MENKIVEEVLEQRGNRYGDFTDIAHFCEVGNLILNSVTPRKEINASSNQALIMIIHKLARAVYGDFNYNDNWIDIIGYANLAIDRLTSDSQLAKTSTLKSIEQLSADEAEAKLMRLVIEAKTDEKQIFTVQTIIKGVIAVRQDMSNHTNWSKIVNTAQLQLKSN